MPLTPEEGRRLHVLNLLEGRQITTAQAAEALELSPRQIRRLRRTLRQAGPAGLAHRSRERPAHNRLAAPLRAQVVALARGRYAGLNDVHLTEKLTAIEGLPVSRATVRRILRAAGVGSPRRRRPPLHRSRRPRRAQAGLLCQRSPRPGGPGPPTDPHDHGVQGQSGRGRGPGRRGLAPQPLDELAASQDPRIPGADVLRPPQGPERAPAPCPPAEASALQRRPPALGPAGRHNAAVGRPRPRPGRAEVGQDRCGRLPGARHGASEGPVARPGVPLQALEGQDHVGPERVQVEIADQLQEVGLLFYHNRLVPVLEEVADPVVAPIEGPPQSGVRRERMLRGSGRLPVRTRRWAWFGRRAQA